MNSGFFDEEIHYFSKHYEVFFSRPSDVAKYQKRIRTVNIDETKKQEIVKDKKFIPVVHSSSPAARPYFNSNYERYEWHMQNGCINQEDRLWLASYIQSNEYKEIYK